MLFKVFNTLTGRKEVFKPIHKEEVRIYTCGPTVYDFAHIGNFRTYVWQDILKRWLLYKNFKVKHIMNLTDVDDKTIRRSREEGVPLNDVTDRFNQAFFEDMKTLNIIPADVFPKATEHIKEMVDLIEKLLANELAYKSKDGSTYYDISEFEDYGKLSKMKIEELKAEAKIKADSYTKEEVRDFALWKAWAPEDGEVFWVTNLGKGRPGWHIECSAMSMKYLGETFDIHTGGVDLIFPHHENEIAQSEGATGKKFVNYWLHAEHLMVEGRKMSKSLGNFYTLRDLLAKGYDPKAIRYTLLSTHYKRQLNFTFQALKGAKNTVDGLFDFMRKLIEIKNENHNPEINEYTREVRKEFSKAMDDNLNISLALNSMFMFISRINKLSAEDNLSEKNAKQIINLMLDFDKVLGLGLEDALKKEVLPEEAKRLIQEREEARKKMDFKTADEIRERLKEKFGIFLEDTAKGVRWKKIEDWER